DGRRGSRPDHRRRPYLEQLEDRVVLTTPSVVSINRLLPLGPLTNASSVSYSVAFNESVTGVDPTDFRVVTGGTVQAATPGPVSGGDASYTVTISGITGIGTLGLNLVANG